MTRPRLLVGVAGTATEVGKTWVTAALASALSARGLVVAARKPVQSFDPASGEPTDAEVLARATGEDHDVVCAPGRSLTVPMAPPMAADVLGLSRPTLDALLGELVWPAGVDIGLVETVGGVCSPIAADGHSGDLVAGIVPDVVLLVADAGLGTIDAVRCAALALGAAGAAGERPSGPSSVSVIVMLNRFEPAQDLHRRNLAWLRDEDGFQVETTVPSLAARLATVLDQDRDEKDDR